MKILTTILILIIYNVISTAQPKQEVDYVNSYIGTAESGAGGLLPSVGPAFAMTSFTAQTRENQISSMPYIYEDSSILGFIATHQPTVWMGDYGYVSVMPQVGKLNVLPQDRKMNFTHKDEFVSPYYYSVNMISGKNTIRGEMAATERCGILKFTFPASDEAHLIIQAINVYEDTAKWRNYINSVESRINKTEAFIIIDKANNEIYGYNSDRQSFDIGPELKNFKGYFVIKIEKSFSSFGIWNKDSVMPMKTTSKGKKILGAYVDFKTKNRESVKLKIATSFISIEQARQNLNYEIPGWDLVKVSQQTKASWQKELEKFRISGVTDEQKTIFYSAYYHCLLYPRIFSEYGRYYSAFDDTIHNGVSYNDFSLWDTFRALHPLLIFTHPVRTNDMITSLLQTYKEGGWLPMWPNPAETNIMIGTHADAVIADAHLKGIKNFDTNLAYEAIRKDAMMQTECDVPVNKMSDRQKWSCYEGQAGQAFFHSIGYLPSDYKSESVSRTVEYGINDYCVAQMAKNLGKKEDYDRLMQWSENYRNLFNRETGFLAPRLFNGNWDANVNEGFTEGSPWTYLFGAMHDIPGNIEMLGGNESFSKMLDRNFAEQHYKHDNEPGHHYIYLYNYCGQSWKTQELTRIHTRINYRNKPDGINGNDDCGQMSAWYIFSVMGFYPVTPASGVYSIGAPQFPMISMEFEVEGSPHRFEIIANNLSEENKYIQKATLDGKPLNKPFINHNDIINGSRLVFEMGAKPNYEWR